MATFMIHDGHGARSFVIVLGLDFGLIFLGYPYGGKEQ